MTAPATTPTPASPLGVACIIGSCISLQLGAALAVQIFPHAGSWATASFRLLIAAVILLVASRPRFWGWDKDQWRAIISLGLSLGLMNGCFYTGIERVPLGTAVTIEFLGPLTLAAVLSRSVRDAVCVVLALAGMALLGVNSYSGYPLDPVGVAFVLSAGFFWALYILASKRAGSSVPGQGGLAVALGIGGLVLMPLSVQGSAAIFSDSRLLALALGTGVLASLIPYSLELIALRRLTPAVFAIIISLEPAFAAFFGWLLLDEHITAMKFTAILLVIAAAVIQTLSGRSTPFRRPLRRQRHRKV
ncbi:EamA family transporter [Corynebacterium appendicis]|uniref:EamA family transporter n=1 Tax=Corynebacterium appendicis TaxID=163202 RepID=UPI002551BA0A|nr:EamA family transporter [Corynebacterium appendicis]MDK8626291.1 EamA family transporter [Corynebacterium appendicis]